MPCSAIGIDSGDRGARSNCKWQDEKNSQLLRSDIRASGRNLVSPKPDRACNKCQKGNVSDCQLAENILEHSAGSGDHKQKRIVMSRTKKGIGQPPVDGAGCVFSLQL